MTPVFGMIWYTPTFCGNSWEDGRWKVKFSTMEVMKTLSTSLSTPTLITLRCWKYINTYNSIYKSIPFFSLLTLSFSSFQDPLHEELQKAGCVYQVRKKSDRYKNRNLTLTSFVESISSEAEFWFDFRNSVDWNLNEVTIIHRSQNIFFSFLTLCILPSLAFLLLLSSEQHLDAENGK